MQSHVQQSIRRRRRRLRPWKHAEVGVTSRGPLRGLQLEARQRPWLTRETYCSLRLQLNQTPFRGLVLRPWLHHFLHQYCRVVVANLQTLLTLPFYRVLRSLL